MSLQNTAFIVREYRSILVTVDNILLLLEINFNYLRLVKIIRLRMGRGWGVV